jgi:hypothetical protein
LRSTLALGAEANFQKVSSRMTLLDRLLDTANECPQRFLVKRDSHTHDAFLNLYERIGYAPRLPAELRLWKERSIDTWSCLDSELPCTYTGGRSGDQLASGAGTLPMSPSIVYGHSWCMEKTLDAAFTLYCQALHSLEWMDRFPDASHWAGSYVYRKRFVKLLQREPLTTSIPDQLGFDVLRCRAGLSHESEQARSADSLIVEENRSGETQLPSVCHAVFRHLSSAHPAMSGIHSVRQFAVECPLTHRLKAIVLLHKAKPELTAINIFSRAWVFPTDDAEPALILMERLQKTELLCDKSLEIVLQKRVSDETALITDHYAHAFWAFAPRSSLQDLRESFRAAFGELMARYPADELNALSSRLEEFSINSPS